MKREREREGESHEMTLSHAAAAACAASATDERIQQKEISHDCCVREQQSRAQVRSRQQEKETWRVLTFAASLFDNR